MGAFTRISMIVAGLSCLFPAAALADDPIGASPGPAGTQAQLIDRLKPEDIAAILQKNGYRATVQSNNNQTFIATGMRGFTVEVLVDDCKGNGCGSLQLVISRKNAALDVRCARNWDSKCS